MRHYYEDEYFYTNNGEITYNKKTGIYTVWDETYANIVCTTVYSSIAEAALEWYCAYLEEKVND